MLKIHINHTEAKNRCKYRLRLKIDVQNNVKNTY